jgi:hypothetical protein
MFEQNNALVMFLKGDEYNTGGYIDFSEQLSDADIEIMISCYMCHHSFPVTYKVDRPITYQERMKIILRDYGLWLCYTCARKENERLNNLIS